MEAIIAAIISAIATIVSAWISRQKPYQLPASIPVVQRGQTTVQQKTVASDNKNNTSWWSITIGLFALIIVCAGFFISHDLPSAIGFFGIPIVAIILSIVKPTKPWTAAAFVFGISTIAFFAESGVKMARGMPTRLLSPDKPLLVVWFVLFATICAVIAASICYSKRKR